MEKKTKIDILNELRQIIKSLDILNKENIDEYIKFIDGELSALKKRQLSAKRRGAKKKIESDELTKVIYEMLVDDDFLTIADIQEELNDESITASKIAARAAKLVKEGLAERKIVKSHGRKRVLYKRIYNDEIE